MIETSDGLQINPEAIAALESITPGTMGGHGCARTRIHLIGGKVLHTEEDVTDLKRKIAFHPPPSHRFVGTTGHL